MTTTTKKDLARQIADHTGCTYIQASEMLDAVFTGMRCQLSAGHRIEVRGFGTLLVKDTPPKPAARNPHTGERISIPARRKALFKPGKQIKQGLSRTRPHREASSPET